MTYFFYVSLEINILSNKNTIKNMGNRGSRLTKKDPM